MKYTWEENDIVCGKIVCKPKEYSGKNNLANQAKWTLKIGFNPEKKSESQYCLIALTDGMIFKAKNRKDLADSLNKDEMIPAPHAHVIEIMNYLRDCY